MTKKSVFCFASSRHQADEIVHHLRTESFSRNDISVLFSEKDAARELTPENATKAFAGTATGVGTGSVVEEPLGWVAGMGVLAIPGVGPCIAAGPIVAGLTAAVEGGIAAGLMRLDISEMEARRYEREVKIGKILLAVHTDDVGDIARVKDIFRQAAAQCIFTSGGAGAKAGAPADSGQHTARRALGLSSQTK
jgi:hypothetical protein